MDAPPTADMTFLRVPADGYSIGDYARMLADRTRMDAYVKALQSVVEPGSVVLDLGTGTGVASIVACRLGARRVIAVEPDDAVEVAREIALLNGLASKIEFVQDISTRLNLDEPADVIVSDLRGVLPFHAQHLTSLMDARDRLLAPGGWLIPWRDTLAAAIISAPETFGASIDVWARFDPEVDMSPAAQIVANTWWQEHFEPDQLVSAPATWVSLDYHSVVSPHAAGELHFVIDRAETVHGLAMWFDAELAPGVGFSSGPGHGRPVYGQAFFPFREAVTVEAGDLAAVNLRAKLVGPSYVWRWRTVVRRPALEEPIATFDQSTILGAVMTPARLRRTMTTHVPTLTDDGRIDLFVLERFARGISLANVAAEVQEAFPSEFADEGEAVRHVSDLSARYSA
jgi:protein arginine N-methyltransferase 1